LLGSSPLARTMPGDFSPHVQLSNREWEALKYLFQGMDYASIARRLKKPNGEPISATTAKQYIERAHAKFAATGRPCRSHFTLLARCIEAGLIRAEDIDDYQATAPASN
jgi:DNA-binding CsgD family transcriptional regulator